MTSSLHVSLPDELRHFVDYRTDGSKDFATPSEYIRSLIRSDMAKQAEELYVFKQILKGADDIENGRIYPASVLDEIDKRMDEEFKDFPE